jgi:hypothetical protein
VVPGDLCKHGLHKCLVASVQQDQFQVDRQAMHGAAQSESVSSGRPEIMRSCRERVVPS